MGEAETDQSAIPRPGVADDRRAGLDAPADEPAEGHLARVGDDFEAQPPEPGRVGWRLAVGQERLGPHFDRARHEQRLAAGALAATREARLAAADPRLVHLHLARQAAASGVDHGPPQLVEHQPGCLVVNAELLGELEGRDAGLERGDEVGGREPVRERHPASVQDGPGGHRALMPAGPALPEPPPLEEPGELGATRRAAEAVRPASLHQVATARLVIWEAAPDLAQVPRVVAKVPRAHSQTLHLVPGGGNPISICSLRAVSPSTTGSRSCGRR